jgi:hypothetical protein
LARTVAAVARVPAFETPRKIGSYDRLAPARALLLPLAFTAPLAAFGFLPAARQNPRLMWSFFGATAALAAWTAILLAVCRSRGRQLGIEIILRKQHYLQACAQGSVLLYWGWYWPQVYAAAPLIAAQLVFAYAVDILLTWSRRDTYTLGFGPFPIILSINLFLWFKEEWFYLQFLMIAVGLAAKELIRWNKDGRRVHIFNPSSFPLGLFSLVLILTGTTRFTWGQEIATTLFLAPNIYLFIFLIGLPGQFLFGVTTMTMSAVVTTYVVGLVFYRMTGTYYFIDSYVPIAVFLGMELLFTDPSTSPKTELGRVMFGVMYGLSVVVLFSVLRAAGAPTFYDKLLAVPILNLLIKGIDAAARSKLLARIDPARLAASVRGRKRHLAFITVWTAVFLTMSATDGVGDAHPGRQFSFWVRACEEGRFNGCRTLANIEDTNCQSGSGWSCNELGLLLTASTSSSHAADAFQRACNTGFIPGCANSQAVALGGTPAAQGTPSARDYATILREGKGALPERTPIELFRRACRQGLIDGCRQACSLGDTAACHAIGR